MTKLSNSNDAMQEKLVAEAVFYAAVRKDGFFQEGIVVLNGLSTSKSPEVKARILAVRKLSFKYINLSFFYLND